MQISNFFQIIFFSCVLLAGSACAQSNVSQKTDVPEWPSGVKTKDTRRAELSYFLDNYDYTFSHAQDVPNQQCQALLEDINKGNFEILEPDLRTTNKETLRDYEVFDTCPDILRPSDISFTYAEIYKLEPYIHKGHPSFRKQYMIFMEGKEGNYLPEFPYMVCNKDDQNCLWASSGRSINTAYCSHGIYPPLALDFRYLGEGRIERKHGVYGLGVFGKELYHFAIPEELTVRPIAEIAKTANAAFIDVHESIASRGETGCYFKAKEKMKDNNTSREREKK